jgi:hypothetical protein
MASLLTVWKPPTPQLLKLLTIDGASRLGELKSELALLAGAKALLTILQKTSRKERRPLPFA